jgi:hypothetical protein
MDLIFLGQKYKRRKDEGCPVPGYISRSLLSNRGVASRNGSPHCYQVRKKEAARLERRRFPHCDQFRTKEIPSRKKEIPSLLPG